MKRIIVVRYGAFGDHIIASSILPHLKAQGWHITMNVNEAGYKVLRHNPHIDAWVHHKTDSVAVEDLPEHWWNLLTSGKYDKMLNLSESLEGTWLTSAGRPGFTWPTSVRQKYLDRNYLEFLHDLAEVPHGFSGAKFYSTPKEKRWARKIRRELGDSFVVVWSLSGSAVHKHTPWLDNAIATLMTDAPWVKVVLVGGPEGVILEQGWETEPRVKCTSGKWGIRQTFSFLEQADCVVGPETGVLNAAGMLDVPKVCILSHSSPENLTKHWLNTTSLTSGVPCHPCHQMHTGWEYCPQVETINGPAARCAADISAETLYRAVVHYADQWKMRAA